MKKKKSECHVAIKFTMKDGCYTTQTDVLNLISFVHNCLSRASSLVNCPDCQWPSRVEYHAIVAGEKL